MRIRIRDTRDATAWLDDLLNGAIGEGVTDLQLRLNRTKARLIVRARVNRVMEEIARAEGHLATEVLNRLKAKAKISTGPAQAISDGLYEHDTGISEHDLRVAVFPSVDGEAAQVRLPSRKDLPKLADVKLNAVNEKRMAYLLGMQNGLLLMAGPMGAGKTTTMYAILGALGGPNQNVFTVEDPVEATLPEAVQIQINEQSRNGWPEVLRGLRRSDLELLMIGEIRNGEQAQAALELGNAGAKVISSIHANNSVGAVHQLLELAKASPRMLGNQLRGVVSQRLVRTIHDACEGAGCDDCTDSGYSGVIPIHEVLVIDDDIVQALVEDAPASRIQQVAQDAGMETLWQAARRLIDDGVTDEKEATRVLGLEQTALADTEDEIPAPAEEAEPDVKEKTDDGHADEADPADSPAERGVDGGHPAAVPDDTTGRDGVDASGDAGDSDASDGGDGAAGGPAYGGLRPLPLPLPVGAV